MSATGERTRAVERRDDSPPLYQIVDYGTGDRAFCAMREQTAMLCDLIDRGGPHGFEAWTSALHLGSTVLIEARMTGLRFDRSQRHIARAGVDHYQLNMCLRGGMQIRNGGLEIELSPGDIGLTDMTCADRTTVSPPGDGCHARQVTLVLPRTLLAPLLAMPDAIGCHLIRGDSPYGRIVRSQILGLWRYAPHLSLTERESATQSLATLVAGGVRSATGLKKQLARAEVAAKRVAIKRFLERSLTSSSEVDLAALCRTFAVSRATLYRMFEPDGGLVRYFRERQLRRAFSMLVSPAHRHCRIVDIALQHGFGTESGFIRAFRRTFGSTPGEVRATGRPLAGRSATHGLVSDLTAAEVLDWIVALESTTPARTSVQMRTPSGGK